MKCVEKVNPWVERTSGISSVASGWEKRKWRSWLPIDIKLL